VLAILAAITTLTVTTATTARPPSTPSSLDPDDFRPLVMADAPAGSPMPLPSIEYGAPASPVPIGDFQEQERSFEPRATPNQPVDADSLLKPTPKPSHSRGGTASWYCKAGVSECHYQYSGGLYAAAGPGLRVGDWRGRKVKVCASGGCVHVTLIDWCACGSGRLIDLYSDAYRRIAPLSSGTASVTVYWW
jgi:Lytic transglycolase